MADRRNYVGEPNIQPERFLHLLATEKHQTMPKFNGAGTKLPTFGIVSFLFVANSCENCSRLPPKQHVTHKQKALQRKLGHLRHKDKALHGAAALGPERAAMVTVVLTSIV